MIWLAVAAGALAVLVYTYVGYPVLVALAARLFPLRPARDPAWTPHVTACIPVVDAEAYVVPKLDSVLGQDWPKDKLDVIVYGDGSKDGSLAAARAVAARDGRVTVIEAAERRGKPTALNRMRAEARGEVLLMTDIRQVLEPGALRAMCTLLADPAVGCVSGNLALRGATGAGAYWRYEKLIREAEGRFRGLVGVSGSIYVVRRDDLQPMPEDTILDDMWVPMKLRLAGRRVLFAKDAIAWDDAADDDREFGRKVRTLAGNYQLFGRLPGLLVPFVSGSWLEIFSHKIARLICPWALLALAAATVGGLVTSACACTGVWSHAFLVLAIGQALFYLGAIAGARAGKLGGLARTFVVLNAAAVVGLGKHLAGRQRITW